MVGPLLYVYLLDIARAAEDHLLRDTRAERERIEIGMREEAPTGREASRPVAVLQGGVETRTTMAGTGVLATAAHRLHGVRITVRPEEVREGVVQATRVMAVAGVDR